MAMAQHGGTPTRTQPASIMAVTTTRLLRITVVVTDRATSDAGNSVCSNICLSRELRGISAMGFPSLFLLEKEAEPFKSSAM
jgi:hypothetical protein